MYLFVCICCGKPFNHQPIIKEDWADGYVCSSGCAIQLDNEKAMSDNGELNYELYHQTELPFGIT